MSSSSLVHGLTTIYNKNYTYKDGVDSTKTTGLIATESIGSNSYSYNYDNVGNITEIYQNGVLKLAYEYDNLNQITREDNAYNNRTYIYVYDKAGNMLFKRTYEYTLLIPEILLSTDTYGYGNANWGDLLTSYNGNTITYDAIGNPTNWHGDKATMTWEGRKLTQISTNWPSYITYRYDNSGIRTYKSIDDYVSGEYKSFYYVTDGSKIIKETRGSNYYPSESLYYYYDESGSVTGFNYNGTTYYYGKNIQGDIKFIYNTSGTIVTEYCYDAWGNILSTTGSMASTVGAINPFRYRGYYYDNESGFYYLNSRYYDPQVGRFINADGQINTQEGLTGYNQFIYCGNNPISRIDPTGQAWWHWVVGAAVVAVCAVAVVVTAGGAAAGIAAVAAVGNGMAAATAASTVAAGAFIGSAAVYGMAVMAAADSSSSLKEFSDQGNWGTVVATTVGAAIGGAAASTLNKGSVDTSPSKSKMADVASKGKAGEAIANVPGIKERIPALVSNATYRIPDGIDHTIKVLSEVKNYAGTLSYTSQLQDFVAYAQTFGYQMHLYTNAHLSGPLQQAVDNGLLQIFPLG